MLLLVDMVLAFCDNSVYKTVKSRKSDKPHQYAITSKKGKTRLECLLKPPLQSNTMTVNFKSGSKN